MFFFLLLWSTYMKRFDFFLFFFFARHRMQAAAYFFFGSLWASDILGLEERAISCFCLKKYPCEEQYVPFALMEKKEMCIRKLSTC